MSPWIGYSSNRSKIPYIKKRNQKLELRQEQWLKVKMNGISRPMWYLAGNFEILFSIRALSSKNCQKAAHFVHMCKMINQKFELRQDG